MKKLIGDLLVEAGLISATQLVDALKVQQDKGSKIVEILISLGHLSADAFVKFLAKQPGIASIGLANYEVARDLIALVPKEFAIKNEVFPVDRLGKLLTLGMVCPLDSQTIEELERTTGLRIKPLLCSPDDIRSAIIRYYPHVEPPGSYSAPPTDKPLDTLVGTMKLSSVVRLIRHIKTLPGLPETAKRVREATTDPKVSVHDVATVIAKDAPVAARVLSVSNSPAYGFRHKVDNLDLAVSLLGLRETYSIVLSIGVINMFEKSKKFDYRSFWQQSLQGATAAMIIARACGKADANSGSRSGVFSAALLQDIGRLALAEVAPDLYAKVDSSLAGPSLIADEERIVGLTHAEAGYELAAHWDLPQEFAVAIRFHHHPERAVEHKDMAAIVGLSDVLLRVEEGANATTFDGMEAALATLNLSRADAECALEEYLSKRSDSAAFPIS